VANSRGFHSGRSRPLSIPKGKTWGIGVGGGDGTVLVLGNNPIGSAITFTESTQTILRTRGRVNLSLTAAVAAVTDRCRVTAGIAIVSSDAVTLGATALPEPETDRSFPWMWWDTWWVQSSSTATPPVIPAQGVYNEVVDVKSMRKVRVDQAIALIVEVSFLTGTIPPMRFSADFRMLVQLAA